MFKNFEEIEDYLINENVKKRIVLCGSHDDLALNALVRAKRKGFVSATLIGDEEKTRALLAEMNEPAEDYVIIHEPREMSAARKAIKMVNEGKADLPMKGLMQTASFLMAIQNPFGGLMEEGGLLNEFTAFYWPEKDRILITGDCAINVAPTLEQKKIIAANLIALAKAFGCETVKVAAVSVIEKQNPDIQSSMDAAALTGMDWGGRPFCSGQCTGRGGCQTQGNSEPGGRARRCASYAGYACRQCVPQVHPFLRAYAICQRHHRCKNPGYHEQPHG